MAKKGITLPNGNRLSHGQLFLRKDDTMQTNQIQRRLNSSLPKDPPNIARDGAPKRTVEAQPVPGQTRREETGGHPLLPNAKRPLDDEPLEKTFQGKGNVPTHSGMVTKAVPDDKYRGKHDPQEGNRVLAEAANLGRKA